MHGFQLWANLPVVAQDDGAALPGGEGGRHSRGRATTTAPRCASSAGASAGRAARWTGSRPKPIYLDVSVPRGQAEDAPGRDDAPRLRVRLRRARGSSATRPGRSRCRPRRSDGRTRRRRPRPTTARSCSSTAATRSRSRPATRGIRFLLVSGKPLGEPVAWYGPIVMNTQEELRQAFEQLNDGTFLDPKAPR